MKNKNKLFLTLLGSFYENLGYTEFAQGLDYMYTSVILDRYIQTFHKMAISQDSAYAHANTRLGFISASEILPNKIIIRDIHGNVMPCDFFSMSYIDIEKFHKIDGNIVDNDAMESISVSTAQKIPVVTISGVDKQFFRNGVFRFTNNVNGIEEHILKMVSDSITYMPNSRRMLYDMVNILAGAVFAEYNEVVERIEERVIYTNMGSYIVPEVDLIVVSVGDMLKRWDLISEVAKIDSIMIGDVAKIQAYVSRSTLSEPNIDFLAKLSSAVSKKSTTILIESSKLKNIPTETLMFISKLFKVSSASNISVASRISNDESLRISSATSSVSSSNSNIEIDMSFVMKLVMSVDSAVAISDNIKTMVNTNIKLEMSDETVLQSAPITEEMIIGISDSIFSSSNQSLLMSMSDKSEKKSSAVMDEIYGISDTTNLDFSTGSEFEIEESNKTNTIVFWDSFDIGDKTESNIVSKNTANIIIDEMTKTVRSSAIDIGLSTTEKKEISIEAEDNIEQIDWLAIQLNVLSDMHISDNTIPSINPVENMNITESSIISEKYSQEINISIEENNTTSATSNDEVEILDTMDISTDTRTDY